MLFLIGLGLGDAKDITVRGLEIVKKVGTVYLENYTSILTCGQQELEEFYGRSLILADRDMVEQDCKQILDAADTDEGAAFLVVGDPMNATTHTDLILRAASRNIPYQIIHNASILNAVACCGLQIYNFGETVSIPFWTDSWKPESFYDKIVRNRKNGLHTLCLLDIKVKEPNYELLIRGIKRTEPARFMTICQASEQLIDIIKRKQSQDISPNRDLSELTHVDDKQQDQVHNLTEQTICVCMARIGSSDQSIVRTTLSGALHLDMGPPLHSLVIPGILHPLEDEMLTILSGNLQNNNDPKDCKVD